MLGQTVAVFFVLALLVAFLWALRRKGLATISLPVARRRNRQRLMQVMERVPLTAHHSLHLVRVEEQVLLIGVSPSGCSQLLSFSAAAFAAKDTGELA